MQNFTPEHLLQYLYNEMNETQKAEIEDELIINWALNEKFQVLRESCRGLNRTKLLSPRRQTISSVLNYAAGKVQAV